MEQKRGVIKLDFNVTNRCNLRCRHCCFKSGELEMGELSLEQIEEVLTVFYALGGKRIDITGGEPLVRQDIDQVVYFAKSLGIKVELVTNATLLTEDRLNKYKVVGVEGIAISLDGSDYQTYSNIRHGASAEMHQRVLRNIRACAEMGFYTKVNTVVFRSNFTDLINIAELAIDLGAREHGFYYFSPIGRGCSNEQDVADPLAWLELIRTGLIGLKNRIKFSLEVPIIETTIADKLNTTCYLENPWHLQILPNGDVFPCAIMAACGRSLANLHQETLGEIWLNEDLWNMGYYNRNVKPLMDEYAGCVNYPSFSHLIKSGEYKFVCLCSKYSIEELLP